MLTNNIVYDRYRYCATVCIESAFSLSLLHHYLGVLDTISPYSNTVVVVS